MNKVCKYCGFTTLEGTRFCGNCGERLTPKDKARYSPGVEIPCKISKAVGSDPLEGLQKAGLEASGQRRNVTILFVDLSDYSHLSQLLDTEDLYEVVQELTRLLANNVYKYEGMVDKFTGDGLMALFGAPISHENNAELAVRAALDMQADVAEMSARMRQQSNLELHIHIGIHSGPVIVGGIGTDQAMNYTAIGDTVNLASRLVDATAPDTIMVSELVYKTTHAIFNFKPSPPLLLKGIEHPVNGYIVAGVKTMTGRLRGLDQLHAPMVGRDRELEVLDQALKNLRDNQQGHFILVTGEAGIGKSRLLQEMKNLSKDNGVTILEGQSLSYRRTVAYWLFLEPLRRLLDMPSGGGAGGPTAGLEEKLAQNLKHRAIEVLPLIEHLLSLKPSNQAAADRLQYLDAGNLRQQIFRAVRDVLAAEAQKIPVLLILEDLHWADSSSLDLLLFLLESVSRVPLMIVAVSRPFENGPLVTVTDHARHHLPAHSTHLALKGLSTEQSEQLLMQLLTVQQLPITFQKEILTRASGIPLFLEEILRMLIDRRTLLFEEGAWQVALEGKDDLAGVPDTLEGLILARVDRLEPLPRRTLQVASVIGREFSLPVLKMAFPEVNEDLLVELETKDFIFQKIGQETGEFCFKHALMSDAIYETLLKRERAELHGRIGTALEQLYANRLEGQVEILARHYGRSQMHDRALHFLILAGQKSARNFDNEQAKRHFLQAQALSEVVDTSPAQKLEVCTGLGDVNILAGEYPEAREIFKSGLGLLDNIPGTETAGIRSSLHRKIGTTYERQGEFQEALECLKQAQETLKYAPQSMPVERAEITNDISWLHFRWGNFDEAERALFDALEMVEDTNRYDVIASIYNRLGGVYYQKDDLERASYFARKSLVLREELGDTIAVARSYNNLGLLNWKQGDWNTALENLKRSIELNTTLGDLEAGIHLHLNVGLLQSDRGELEEARFHLEEGLKRARQVGHSFLEGLAEMHLSRMCLAAREWEQSLEHSQRALATFQEIGTQENLIDLYASLSEAHLYLGDIVQASANCSKAAEILQDTAELADVPSLESGRLYRLRGSIALSQGDLETANSNLKKSIEHFTALKNQVEVGRTLYRQSLLARARSDRMAERLLASEARLIFRQLGAKLDLLAVEELFVH